MGIAEKSRLPSHSMVAMQGSGARMVGTSLRSRVRRRKYLREIGTIVLGVLIALGLGAIASEIGWRIDAATAREAIADELGEIVGQGLQRERADRCVERKLDVIAGLIDRGARSGRLPAVGSIGEPLYRTWSSGVWESTISADIASHMNREELDNLSGVYEFVDDVRISTADEMAAWRDLYAIVGPGRAIGEEELVRLRSALTRARSAHRSILIAGIRMDQITWSFDLPVNSLTIEQYRDEPISRICAPVASYAGERYGSAPFPGVIERVRKHAPGGEESRGSRIRPS